MVKNIRSFQKLIKNRTILLGDVLEKLEEIPKESIDTIISSPPYWGLRDYGVEGQWGLEKDFLEYLEIMQKFMNQCKRVLKNTGTCFINLGDTYSGGYNHSDWKGTDNEKKIKKGTFKAQYKNQIAAKSRYGIPERFYADCIDNGWIARNNIVWYKSNAMPQSVKDRLTNKYEPVFFFAKSQKYHFDLDAIRIKPLTETKAFNVRIREAKKGMGQAKLGDSPKAYKMTDEEDLTHDKLGQRKTLKIPGQRPQGIHRNRKEGLPDFFTKQDNTLRADGKPDPTKKGFNERYKIHEGEPQSLINIKDRIAHARLVEGKDHDTCLNNPLGKNPGDMITADYTDEELLLWIRTVRENEIAYELCPTDILMINPKPLPDAHFATFPIELPHTLLKAACPKDGTVLDPFFGAGTTGVAAEMLGLNWIGIELKDEYADIARKRLDKYRNIRLGNF